MFFLCRSQEIKSAVFVLTLENGRYTLLNLTSYYVSGFIIGIIGMALLPFSSILVLSNATKLRIAKEDEEKKKQRKDEDLAQHVGR